MKKILFGIIILVIAAAGFWLYSKNFSQTSTTNTVNIDLSKLQEVTKLVIWEQDFTLNEIEEKERKYLKLFTTKETLSTTINGKMGFHVDLSDTSSTKISRTNDTIFIVAPLRITYVSLDLGSLQQVKDASLDPTLNINEQDILKKLDQKALEKYLPKVKAFIETQPLTYQEKQLSGLIGKPVKLIVASLPVASDWKR